MSIRLRLTLWQTVLLGLVLAAFAAVVYTAIAQQESSELNFMLAAQAENVEIELARAQSAAGEDGRSGLAIEALSPFADRAIGAALRNEALAVQILGPRGEDIARSENLDQPLAIQVWLLEMVKANTSAPGVVQTLAIDGEAMRVYGQPAKFGGAGPPGAIFVASSLARLDAAMERWRAILAAAVVGTTATAAAVGWFLAAQAMRPVDQMTQAARAIGRTADFSRRLPQPRQLDELGRLAATFNDMLDQLAGAYTTQKQFLADASHELRTPLTVIRTSIESLRRGLDDDPVKREETLRAIARESERMGRLVADLLTLARADAGQLVDRRRLELDTLVLEVYTQQQTLADGVGLRLGEWDQIPVEGDADRLKQVVLNLVDNALRYTPRGGTVTIDLLRRDDEAVLQVSDTGPGIPPEQLPRVFERFYRIDQPRSRGAGGTGLGLAIARDVAEAHGGRIEVASRVGEGSTFSLVLPIAGSPVNPDLPARDPDRAREPSTPSRA